MVSNDLIIDFLETRIKKVKALKVQKYQLAADIRDIERNLSKEIYSIITQGSDFISFADCDNTIDDYCLTKYNCSIYDAHNCIKSIEREKKLDDLGI